MEAKTYLRSQLVSAVTSLSLDSTVCTRTLHWYLCICTQMLISRDVNKWLHMRHCVLKHMTAHETRGFLPSNGFKLVCVSWRHAVFSGSLQLLKTTWNTKQSMNYTEWTASQLSVFASKGCIYFTCQKTDFHSLGDILMWFKSGVEILFGMWHHWINIKLSQIFKWVLLNNPWTYQDFYENTSHL